MNKSTLFMVSVLSLASVVTPQALAVEGLSANAGITNNYLWRGISQTEDQSAVFGGIDYVDKSGLYVGAWASNVKYGTANSEVDLYLGYGVNVDQVSLDVGYLYYGYPGGDDLAFSELYASATWQFATLGYHVLVDSDAGDDFGASDYLFVDLAFDVAEDLTLGFHYGHSSFDDSAIEDLSDFGLS